MVICVGCWIDEEVIKSIGIRVLSVYCFMIIGLLVFIVLCCVMMVMLVLMI